MAMNGYVELCRAIYGLMRCTITIIIIYEVPTKKWKKVSGGEKTGEREKKKAERGKSKKRKKTDERKTKSDQRKKREAKKSEQWTKTVNKKRREEIHVPLKAP